MKWRMPNYAESETTQEQTQHRWRSRSQAEDRTCHIQAKDKIKVDQLCILAIRSKLKFMCSHELQDRDTTMRWFGSSFMTFQYMVRNGARLNHHMTAKQQGQNHKIIISVQPVCVGCTCGWVAVSSQPVDVFGAYNMVLKEDDAHTHAKHM